MKLVKVFGLGLLLRRHICRAVTQDVTLPAHLQECVNPLLSNISGLA